MTIITIIRIVVCFQLSSVDTSAQSNVLDLVSDCDVAEKRSKTCAYQTESGDTTKAPWSRPGGLIMTRDCCEVLGLLAWFSH